MRGRSCTQPFLVEKSACRPDALLFPPRWANRSPPHPTRLRRPTFPPRGRLWGWEGPFPSEKPPPPARPAGGRAVTGVRYRAAGQAEKRENPPGSPQPEKVGPGRKNLFLPGVLSSGFLPKKAGPPPGAGRATGRCAPRHRKSPDHPKGTQYHWPGPRPHLRGARSLFLPQRDLFLHFPLTICILVVEYSFTCRI